MSGKPRLVTHQFTPAGITDGRGIPICTCDMIQDASVHRVPERSEEQRAEEARRIGEAP